MSKQELHKRLGKQNKIKWSFVENHLADWRVEQLQEQLKGVTMTTDEDGDTVVPTRDLRKALKNPGKVV